MQVLVIMHVENEGPGVFGELLRAAAARDLPVLGICLGAQMIAKAAGAAVRKNRVEVIGWGTVNLTGDGLAASLFRGLPATIPVFQWHGDTFDVPEGGALLATGDLCHHQAFRFRNSYGLQFHLEADRTLLAEWFAGKEAGSEILRRCDELAPEIGHHVRTLFANFMEIAAQPR